MSIHLMLSFMSVVSLDPAADNWTRTIYIDNRRTESSGAEWTQEASVHKDVDQKSCLWKLTERVVVEMKKD